MKHELRGSARHTLDHRQSFFQMLANTTAGRCYFLIAFLPQEADCKWRHCFIDDQYRPVCRDGSDSPTLQSKPCVATLAPLVANCNYSEYHFSASPHQLHSNVSS